MDHVASQGLICPPLSPILLPVMNNTNTSTKYVAEIYTAWESPKVRFDVISMAEIQELQNEGSKIRSIYELGKEVNVDLIANNL